MVKNTTLLWIISTVTVLFCVAIAFDITPYLRGPAPYYPDWRWEYLFVNTLNKIWVPLLVIGVILFFARWVELLSESKIIQYQKRIISITVVLFFLLQFSLLYFSRAGVGVLLARIINPDMNGYFTAANNISDIKEFLYAYNNIVLHLPMHATGHPAGAILIFWVIVQVFDFLKPFLPSITLINIDHSDIGLIWKGLSESQKFTALFSSIFIPFLSTLAIPFVYFITKIESDSKTAMRAIVLYALVPSLLFFIPINDVFLPLFVLSSFLFLQIGIKQAKNNFIIISGFCFSVGLFFSMSLLPIIFLFFLYVILKQKSLKLICFTFFKFFSGFFILPIILFLLWRYNTIEIFITLMTGLPKERAYMTWVFYNLYDFFIFSGVPLLVIFLLFCNETIKLYIGRKNKLKNFIGVSFLGMIVLLDISGAVRGEVARIWIPFYGFLVITLAIFITKNLKISKNLFLFILLFQCIQILCMQEFWVMLW